MAILYSAANLQRLGLETFQYIIKTVVLYWDRLESHHWLGWDMEVVF